MGRKGVSKRKPVQTKSAPLTGNKASGSVSSAMQAAEPSQVKSFDISKTDTFTKGNSKKSKKG